jgi:hypothetical protein
MNDNSQVPTDSARRGKLPQDPVVIGNPERTKADFTYSMTPAKLVIRDTGKGEKSVIEDLAAVIRKIEYWHQGSLGTFKITVLDPDGKPVQIRPSE